MTLSIPAVVHGTIDPTFASRVASKLIAAENVTFTETERARIGVLAEEVRAELFTETNRIEGQLTSMLSYTEGKYESDIARLRLVKIHLPVLFGAVVGFALGFIVSFFTR